MKTGLELLQMASNEEIPNGTIIRHKKDNLLLSNPPQPEYEYYIYTTADGRFHRCNEKGKLGAKGQPSFMNYQTLHKEFEIKFPVAPLYEELKAPSDIPNNSKGFRLVNTTWEEKQMEELIDNFHNVFGEIKTNRMKINEITECLVLLIEILKDLKEGK